MHAWRWLAALMLLGATGAMIGAAASLGLSSGSLGAATQAVPRCTAGGLTVFQNLLGGTVISVTVGGLPAACGNALLQVTTNNGTTSGSGSATVPAAGGAVTVALVVPPALTAAEQTDLVLTGP